MKNNYKFYKTELHASVWEEMEKKFRADSHLSRLHTLLITRLSHEIGKHIEMLKKEKHKVYHIWVDFRFGELDAFEKLITNDNKDNIGSIMV